MVISIQDVYISDTGCQMVLKVNTGPGKFIFAFPAPDKVQVLIKMSLSI